MERKEMPLHKGEQFLIRDVNQPDSLEVASVQEVKTGKKDGGQRVLLQTLLGRKDFNFTTNGQENGIFCDRNNRYQFIRALALNPHSSEDRQIIESALRNSGPRNGAHK